MSKWKERHSFLCKSHKLRISSSKNYRKRASYRSVYIETKLNTMEVPFSPTLRQSSPNLLLQPYTLIWRRWGTLPWHFIAFQASNFLLGLRNTVSKEEKKRIPSNLQLHWLLVNMILFEAVSWRTYCGTISSSILTFPDKDVFLKELLSPV